MLVFLIIVLNSKHLHIFVAPINIMFKRPDGPVALGAVKPMISDGKAITLEDVEDLDEDTVLGIGSIEDFSWKGLLDMASCTECGRCQSQCPAWNTEKPLSPKMLIMNLARPRVREGAVPDGRRRARREPSPRRRTSWPRPSARWSVSPRVSTPGTPRAARSSTTTCSGPAPTAVPA